MDSAVEIYKKHPIWSFSQTNVTPLYRRFEIKDLPEFESLLYLRNRGKNCLKCLIILSFGYHGFRSSNKKHPLYFGHVKGISNFQVKGSNTVIVYILVKTNVTLLSRRFEFKTY